jgi:hypothetical protein
MKLRDIMDQVEGFVNRAEVSTTKEQVLHELKSFRTFIKELLSGYQVVKRPPKKSEDTPKD